MSLVYLHMCTSSPCKGSCGVSHYVKFNSKTFQIWDSSERPALALSPGTVKDCIRPNYVFMSIAEVRRVVLGKDEKPWKLRPAYNSLLVRKVERAIDAPVCGTDNTKNHGKASLVQLARKHKLITDRWSPKCFEESAKNPRWLHIISLA